MKKLIDAKNSLRKNGKKGFTLVELIVVIVIIAILVAALTPAILGVIRRANQAADQADARAVMMGASVAGIGKNGIPAAADVQAQFTGGVNITNGTYTVYFDSGMAVGCKLEGGRVSDAAVIGNTSAGTSQKYIVSNGVFTLGTP